MLFGKPIYILLKQHKAKQAVSDNMSVRINMQTDETKVFKNGNGFKNEDHHENGDDMSGGDVQGHHNGEHHDEVSPLKFRIKQKFSHLATL